MTAVHAGVVVVVERRVVVGGDADAGLVPGVVKFGVAPVLAAFTCSCWGIGAGTRSVGVVVASASVGAVGAGPCGPGDGCAAPAATVPVLRLSTLTAPTMPVVSVMAMTAANTTITARCRVGEASPIAPLKRATDNAQSQFAAGAASSTVRPRHHLGSPGGVAQLVEQRSFKSLAAGSRPATPTSQVLCAFLCVGGG